MNKCNHYFKDRGLYRLTFKGALSEIMEFGSEVKPRGMLTKEVSPATMEVNPRYSLYDSKIRKLNFAFLLAENLWYLGGRADTFLLSYYNSNIKSFSQDGLHDGAYGPKIVAQLRYIIETLQKDPDSRQAILSIWERNPRPSKDVPCTSLFQFMIRDGMLNMYVTMRSNDIIFGSNYDIPSFSLIQIVVASCLGIPTGKLFLTANSLHLYETHFDLARQLLDEEDSYNIEDHPIMMQPKKTMSLEDHVRQIDLVLAFESSIRHFKTFDNERENEAFESLDKFYQQYVVMFDMYRALKEKNTIQRDSCVEYLKSIGSPFGKIYSERYSEDVQ